MLLSPKTHTKSKTLIPEQSKSVNSAMSDPIDKQEMEALHLLNSTDPTAWLVPSESLSKATKTASQHLFARLKPHVPKSPFDKLLVEGFDAEQIWQQLDLQSQPLISSLRRQVRQWEKNPEELIGIFRKNEKEKKVVEEKKKIYDDEVDMDEFDGDDVDIEGSESDDDDDEDEEKEESGGEEKGVEDKFLKIKELEEFLEEDEAREYGLDRKSNKKKRNDDLSSTDEEEDEDEDEEENEDEDEGDEDDDDDDELGIYEDGGEDDLGNIKYKDFFADDKKRAAKGRLKLPDEFEEESSDSDDELGIGGANEENAEPSNHEKQLQKLQSEIEQMEKENLEAKHWTMQGEVTAANRPKNSALEEVLDYERKARAPIVVDKDFHASLEDMIKERIIKGQFDDVERIASVPSKGPRELKELDDNKSKKGLAEVYEEEYVQKTNPAAAPSSFTDEQKKEASLLFKKLCLKLDALSHFHFAPKPVIEDMSIQANVPALAMEEIAPTAVSDAAMLAPEEVFSGKGDIKDEAELTQAERKRRRADKKRKFKAETAKRMAKMPKKAQDNSLQDSNDGKEE